MASTSKNLTDQVAIVTGGGRGIGRFIAERLAKEGAAITVFGRDINSLEDTVARIKSAGGKAIAVAGDVISKADIDALVQKTEKELGPVTLLVNNAGVGGAGGPLWLTDPDEWWQVMEVNLKGPLLTTHAVLGGMVQRGNGRIINVGSYVGVLPNAMGSSYSTSKAALLRLTDCTAEGVKEAGVSVFAISPGYVKTDMTRELEEQQRAANPDFEPMDEAWVFPPEDAAVLCVRLASGEADALTGRFIHVRDNLDDMIATADEIVNQDRYALRLNVDLGV